MYDKKYTVLHLGHYTNLLLPEGTNTGELLNALASCTFLEEKYGQDVKYIEHSDPPTINLRRVSPEEIALDDDGLRAKLAEAKKDSDKHSTAAYEQRKKAEALQVELDAAKSALEALQAACATAHTKPSTQETPDEQSDSDT